MNKEKPISSKNGGDDRKEHQMAWSTLSRNNSCPMSSKQAEEGVIRADQQQSKNIEQLIKRVKTLERFALIIVVIFHSVYLYSKEAYAFPSK